jgi:iron complex outermembrane receptor protein
MQTVLAILLASGSPTLVQAEPPKPDVGPDETKPEGGLDEIVVTAQRRSESLQRTAVSVTALDSVLLERLQMVDTKQVIFNAPNLTGNSNVGQATATTFFIRGVGTTENLATADTSVGLYLDDVYIARQAVNNFSLADIERIEVLRGPQGTLYGRNTNGGAIKVVAKKPDDVLALAASASYGNYDRSELRLSANVPLSETVFVRANFLTQQGDGYIFNRTLSKQVNDQDYIGGRLAIRVLPSDRFTIDLTADFSRDVTNGGYASDVAGVLRPTTGSLFEVVSGTDARGFARTYGGALRMEWNASETVTVESISGLRWTDQDLLLDLSDQPVPLYILDQVQNARQFSQELKANLAAGDRLDLTLGAFYFRESIDALVSDFVRASPVAAQSRFTKDFSVEIESYALFGQAELEVVPGVRLSAAGRYTWEDRVLDVTQTSSIPGPNFNFDTASLVSRAAQGQNIDPDRSFGEFTPRLGVDWTVNPDLFVYASWTKGFRSGGWTGRALQAPQYVNFDPETVESYEFGSKISLFDRAVRWNNSIFYMKYGNLFNTLTIDGAFTVQVADAQIYGLESELTWRVKPWLDVFANFGLIEAEYVGDRPANLADRLQRAPAFQGKTGFSIEKPTAGGAFLLNADVFYTSSYLVTPANLRFTAPLVPPDANVTRAFALVNAAIGYRFGADERWSLTASCTNCLNRDYFDAQTVIGAWAAAYAGAPRFYKITAAVRF